MAEVLQVNGWALEIGLKGLSGLVLSFACVVVEPNT